jgi:hypothetical protein
LAEVAEPVRQQRLAQRRVTAMPQVRVPQPVVVELAPDPVTGLKIAPPPKWCLIARF